MKRKEIEAQAEVLRRKIGGRFFAFPAEPENPYSKYVFTAFIGGKYKTYPKQMDISETAANIKVLLEALIEEGYEVNFERDVRFSMCDVQLNAPSIQMKKLRDNNGFVRHK